MQPVRETAGSQDRTNDLRIIKLLLELYHPRQNNQGGRAAARGDCPLYFSEVA